MFTFDSFLNDPADTGISVKTGEYNEIKQGCIAQRKKLMTERRQISTLIQSDNHEIEALESQIKGLFHPCTSKQMILILSLLELTDVELSGLLDEVTHVLSILFQINTIQSQVISLHIPAQNSNIVTRCSNYIREAGSSGKNDENFTRLVAEIYSETTDTHNIYDRFMFLRKEDFEPFLLTALQKMYNVGVFPSTAQPATSRSTMTISFR